LAGVEAAAGATKNLILAINMRLLYKDKHHHPTKIGLRWILDYWTAERLE
jgi:hypothetical protein